MILRLVVADSPAAPIILQSLRPAFGEEAICILQQHTTPKTNYHNAFSMRFVTYAAAVLIFYYEL